MKLELLLNPCTFERVTKFCDGVEGGDSWDLEKVAENGHLALLEYMHNKAENAPEFATSRVMDAASEFGHISMVEWLQSKQQWPSKNAAFLATQNGHIDIARFLHRHYHVYLHEFVLKNVAKHGNIEHMDFFLHQYWDSSREGLIMELVYEAIANGHVTLSEWLLLQQQRNDQWQPVAGEGYQDALRKAARGGHLEILEHAHSRKGWPPTYDWIALAPEAAQNGHVHVVQWLLENINTWGAERSGSVGPHPLLPPLAISFFRSSIDQSFQAAVSSGHMSVLAQLHAKYPRTLAALDTLNLRQPLVSGNVRMLEWLFGTAPGLISNQIQQTYTAGTVDHEKIIQSEIYQIVGGGHLPLLKWLRLHFPLQFWPRPNELQCAAQAGLLGMAEWLVASGATAGGAFEGGTIPLRVGHRSLVVAATGGHYSVVEWLLRQPGVRCVSSSTAIAAFRAAFCAGKDRTARLLLHEFPRNEGGLLASLQASTNSEGWNKQERLMPSQQDLAIAISEGHLGCLALAGQVWGWDALPWPPLAANLAVQQVGCRQKKRVETLRFLHKWLPESARPLASRLGALATAARRGEALTVHWLHENLYQGMVAGPAVLDFAAAQGRLEVVRFLTDHRPWDGASECAMDLAAGNGHLGVVRYLHRHRTEGCTAGAAARAAVRGHQRVLEYLLRHQLVPCSQLELVKAIHGLNFCGGAGNAIGLAESALEGVRPDLADYFATGRKIQYPAVVRFLIAMDRKAIQFMARGPPPFRDNLVGFFW
eukprot:CAMPEP_0206384240 /NCGR_PEP_ID=MMETSP0294-20121207/14453_1 /ASSEMBLY_ACC=CAM_ASM_000327 /TAXON_ID=39354 /ORGANISM="Heterosigma akashiwo, Strain CCMP2393" /LENGTH=762 /DNA_ID=CAMNT_0053834505 /DNA_START=154 /DNA_END=2439 /DNA_ORIENTATION=-